MNYEQANSVKELAAPVNKVLEGLEWECNKCNGKGKVSQTLAYTKLPTHNVKPIYKPCNKCNGKGKIPYIWTPQVGEWCIWNGNVRLIEKVANHNNKVWCVFNHSIELPEGVPWEEARLITLIPEWEVIEEVLEKAGYWLEVKKPLEKYIKKDWMKVSASIYEDIGKNAAGNGKYVAYAIAKSRLIAVYKAMKGLEKEI